MSTLVVPASATRLRQANSPEERELDAAVEALCEHTKVAAAGIWKMAITLRRILLEGLWKHRANADGSSRYQSFKDFVESETTLTYSHAFKLAHAAGATSEDYDRFGLRKLYAIACAPETVHAELRVACEAGESAAEIERRARAARSATRDKSLVVPACSDDNAEEGELIETPESAPTRVAGGRGAPLDAAEVEPSEPPARVAEPARWPEKVSVEATRQADMRYVGQVRLGNGLVVKVAVDIPDEAFDDVWFSIEVGEVGS